MLGPDVVTRVLQRRLLKKGLWASRASAGIIQLDNDLVFLLTVSPNGILL